ncbi:hypothetical protein [Methylobacterium sp. WL7]|uniref:hypothetical protein n=1 Tax=Methylobacterium sp. WL7 TaxID=2603900 RepID=UPI0011CAFBCA|nr:hypothetical protein [Methylobacterium sp. WL7]TXN43579.1 hypothetical protein FV233_17940 [Methylobacterium sp. WL7]
MTRELSSRSHATHGLSHHPLFKIWRGIQHRCKPDLNPRTKNYGFRGIRVSPEWSGPDGAIRFIAWGEANGYRGDLEIDRIDNNGDYSPSNCRWVTRSENCLNRRNNVIVEFGGERLPFKKCVEKYGSGISYAKAHTRLRKGWPIEEVLMGRKCRHQDLASSSLHAEKR